MKEYSENLRERASDKLNKLKPSGHCESNNILGINAHNSAYCKISMCNLSLFGLSYYSSNKCSKEHLYLYE